MTLRGRPPLIVLLRPGERSELERRVRASSSSQESVKRARIILASDGAHTAEEISRTVGVPRRTVERWRRRFVTMGLRGLENRPRKSRPRKIGPVARAEVISIACEPVKTENGTTRRTIEDVQQRVLERGVIDEISWSSVQRILSEGDLRPHRIQGWMHSQDPLFREKVTEVVELYLKKPSADEVVLCVDEKSGMHARERRFPDRPARPGRATRVEYEYRRHGTQTLIASFEVHTGRVHARCGDRRTAPDLVEFMEELAAEYPTQKVHIVWDNLNIHYDGPDERWTRFNARHGSRFHFHYTPKHASWVNQIELFFSVLHRRSLARGSFTSKEHLRTTVLDFIDHWNDAEAHPFRWTFTGYPLQTGLDTAA